MKRTPPPVSILFNHSASRPSAAPSPISVTLLSSLLQKEVPRSQPPAQQDIMITQMGMGQVDEFVAKAQANPRKTYDKWRRLKEREGGQRGQGRLLGDLVGPGWEGFRHCVDEDKFRGRVGGNRLKEKRQASFFEEQTVKNSKRLMQSHFRTFVHSKKLRTHTEERPRNYSQVVVQQKNLTFNTAKTSMLLTKGTTKSTTIRNLNKSSHVLALSAKTSPKALPRNRTSSPEHRTKSKTSHSRQRPFKWSRVEGSRRFSLADISYQ